jgi:hypothetical protein
MLTMASQQQDIVLPKRRTSFRRLEQKLRPHVPSSLAAVGRSNSTRTISDSGRQLSSSTVLSDTYSEVLQHHSHRSKALRYWRFLLPAAGGGQSTGDNKLSMYPPSLDSGKAAPLRVICWTMLTWVCEILRPASITRFFGSAPFAKCRKQAICPSTYLALHRSISLMPDLA